MTISELNELIGGKLLTTDVDAERTVECGLSCDLLSWVMAKGSVGCAWTTVQTHMNVIAVAALHDMACVILSEGVEIEDSVLDKATEEGIAVIRTDMPAYKICGIMYQNGIPASESK